MRARTANWCLALVLLTGCSSGVAAPVAQVAPFRATIDAAATFTPFRNNLGDQLEALNVHITSDIPVAARVQVDLAGVNDPIGLSLSEGDKRKACDPDGCLLTNGAADVDWWCSNACPKATYQLTLMLCSYAENKDGLDSLMIECNHQESGYLEWVGHWGTALKGNPLAKPDVFHNAILNLQRVITFTH